VGGLVGEQDMAQAPDSQPHRALWDTVGTALLLPALISDLAPGTTVTLADLITTAGLTVEAASAREHKPPPQQEQGTLFDPA
jgi:DNA polymerase III subunit epsilon